MLQKGKHTLHAVGNILVSRPSGPSARQRRVFQVRFRQTGIDIGAVQTVSQIGMGTRLVEHTDRPIDQHVRQWSIQNMR